MSRISVDYGGIVPQLESYHLGGVKTILGRLTFYVGFFNLVLLVPTAFNSSPTLRAAFPNVFVFAGVIVVLLALAGLFELAVVYPSQLTFAKAQASKNERDPIYREVRRLHDRLDSLFDDDRGHLHVVCDGAGCAEVWEQLSDRRRDGGSGP